MSDHSCVIERVQCLFVDPVQSTDVTVSLPIGTISGHGLMTRPPAPPRRSAALDHRGRRRTDVITWPCT